MRAPRDAGMAPVATLLVRCNLHTRNGAGEVGDGRVVVDEDTVLADEVRVELGDFQVVRQVRFALLDRRGRPNRIAHKLTVGCFDLPIKGRL